MSDNAAQRSRHESPQTCPDRARESDLVGVIVSHGRGTKEGHNGAVLSDEEFLNILPRSTELLAANYTMDLQPVVGTCQVMRLLVFTFSVCRLFFSCSGNDSYVFPSFIRLSFYFVVETIFPLSSFIRYIAAMTLMCNAR